MGRDQSRCQLKTRLGIYDAGSYQLGDSLTPKRQTCGTRHRITVRQTVEETAGTEKVAHNSSLTQALPALHVALLSHNKP
jgi:hypothetical protein